MSKEVFTPTVLFHGTAEYNIPVIATHGLASERGTLTPSPIFAMTGAWQEYRGSNLALTVWYTLPGDVKTYTSDYMSYEIEIPITDIKKELLRQALEEVLKDQSEIERRFRLTYFQGLNRLLPPNRLGAYFQLNDTIGVFLKDLETFGQKSDAELESHLHQVGIVCCNMTTISKISQDIITTVAQFRKIHSPLAN